MEKKNKFSSQMLFHIMLLLFFGLLFVIGTFNDEAIAKAIYMPDNLPALIVTTLGIYPYFASVVLFMGALYERAVHSGQGKAVKVLLCAVCAAIALGTGFAGALALVSKDCLGGMFPFLNKNYPVIAAISAVAAYPLFFVGYHFAKKSEDKQLAKKLITLIIIQAIAFGLMEVLKFVFCRPRYRIAVQGFEGIGFVPWYTKFQGAAGFVAALGLESTDFRSFPSGHSILSISCIYILLSLVWLFPKLRKRQNLLCCAGLLFGMLVMFTRMMLGAHYLSDVSAGAIIGTVLSLVYTVIQHIIAGKMRESEKDPAGI